MNESSARLTNQVDTATRARVLAYFSSLSWPAGRTHLSAFAAPPRPMLLLQFYAQLLFQAAALLTAGLALVCLAGIMALGGALPGVEMSEQVGRAAAALHRKAGRLLASARARNAPEPTVSGSGDAG